VVDGGAPGGRGTVGRTMRRLTRLPAGARPPARGGRLAGVVAALLGLACALAVVVHVATGAVTAVRAGADRAAAGRATVIAAEFAAEMRAATSVPPPVLGPFDGVMIVQRLAPGRTEIFDVVRPTVPAAAGGYSLLGDVAAGRVAAAAAATAATNAADGYLLAVTGGGGPKALARAGRAAAAGAAASAAAARRAYALTQSDRAPLGVDHDEAVLAALRAAELADISSLRATAAARRTQSLEAARARH